MDRRIAVLQPPYFTSCRRRNRAVRGKAILAELPKSNVGFRGGPPPNRWGRNVRSRAFHATPPVGLGKCPVLRSRAAWGGAPLHGTTRRLHRNRAACRDRKSTRLELQ